jgi:hypothetical protein
MNMTERATGKPSEAGSEKNLPSCKPQEWPSKESAEQLKQLLAVAKETADTFHRQAQIDPDSLHDPVTL